VGIFRNETSEEEIKVKQGHKKEASIHRISFLKRRDNKELTHSLAFPRCTGKEKRPSSSQKSKQQESK
jgi:hypothetical protein